MWCLSVRIETKRLVITDFTPDMARAVHLGSLDANTRRFVPDEVFATEEIAASVIADLTACYAGDEGPFVHPFLADGQYAGYVQLVPLEDGEWEVGYHTVEAFCGRGYATEALMAFLPVMMERLRLTRVYGICLADNVASVRIMEKCGFAPDFSGDSLYQGAVRPIVRMVYHR